MNAKINKRTAAALAAGLIALLLPTGCTLANGTVGGGGTPPDGERAPGSAVVAPLHIVV